MKKCLYCGKELIKKKYEEKRDFERRSYCNKLCFNNHRIEKRKEKLIGNRYGKLIVKDLFKEGGEFFVLVLCDCGNEKKYKYTGFKVSKPTHCGCSNANITHGMSKTALYKSWVSMKRRCDNPDDFHKKYYVDKGIKYCDEWKDFACFSKWALNNGYVDGYTIERLDNSKGYFPENCIWIPAKDQSKNRTTNHLVEINGVKKPISVWCEEYGIKWTTFYARLKSGKTGKDLIRK